MLCVLSIIAIEVGAYLFFLHRKTKYGKKLVIYLMKRQEIPRILTMKEVDERLDEICKDGRR